MLLKIVSNFALKLDTLFSHTNSYNFAIAQRVTLMFTLQRSTQIIQLGVPVVLGDHKGHYYRSPDVKLLVH